MREKTQWLTFWTNLYSLIAPLNEIAVNQCVTGIMNLLLGLLDVIHYWLNAGRDVHQAGYVRTNEDWLITSDATF